MSNSEEMNNFMFPFNKDDNYFKEPVSFKDCDDHYELIYTGEFESIGRNSTEMINLLRDLKEGNKDKELHILISSIGGDVENLILILQQVLLHQLIPFGLFFLQCQEGVAKTFLLLRLHVLLCQIEYLC